MIGNPLVNLNEFHHFKHLEYLELCSVQLQALPTDFSFQFPNLIVLYLGGNYLTDITALSGCSSLQKLVLLDNRLDEVCSLIKTLKQLPSLYFLDLR
jgi:Leucine-rich repeat (LRR) protein